MTIRTLTVALLAAAAFARSFAQETPAPPPPEGDRSGRGGFPGFGPGGPMGGADREIVKQFDVDGDERLDATERAKARAWLKENPARRGGFGPRPGGRGPGGPGGPGGRGVGEEAKPGPKVSPDDVKPEAQEDLYAPHTLRTLFFDFEGEDWEQELADFHGTDVEVPATLTVDGTPGVGVHFRGMTS